MKKSQISNKLLTYSIAIIVGFVIFYAVFLVGKALFGFQLGGKKCELVPSD